MQDDEKLQQFLGKHFGGAEEAISVRLDVDWETGPPGLPGESDMAC